MIQPLISALEKGNVKIKYRSLISGKEKEEVFTLKGVNMPQNPSNDKLVVLRHPANTYEDLEKSTIISWIKLY